MTERLAERERRFAAYLPPSDRAKRLARSLEETAAELRRMAQMAPTEAIAELRELDVERIEQAIELLYILDQEQWRQREAVKLFLHGRYTFAEVRHVAETWNQSHG